ncbi:chaperonin 10-like protein [Thamnidium elegans]|nr:chaperonin 10-like protein [Thamnidium elegans]
MKTTTITQFVSTNERGKFKSISTKITPLSHHEIIIKILACGICHTDCMYMGRDGDVLGHEAVGKIIEKGSSVERLNVGDIVGTSYLKSACLVCGECNSGQDIMCQHRIMFPEGNMNGFAEYQVCDSRFAYKLPDGMEPKYAGPLFCAGVTVFNALYSSKIPPTGRVAVLGIGGLGHLALQFCRAWGVHCTAVSRSLNKKEEALSFGAHDFLASKDFTPEYIDKLEKYDVIINTISGDLDWDLYLSLLNRNGTFYLIGVPGSSIEIKNPAAILTDQKSIKGSIVGGRYVIELMLEFAQRHHIKPKIEEYPLDLDGLHAAIERCEKGQARYRAVLVAKE